MFIELTDSTGTSIWLNAFHIRSIMAVGDGITRVTDDCNTYDVTQKPQDIIHATTHAATALMRTRLRPASVISESLPIECRVVVPTGDIRLCDPADRPWRDDGRDDAVDCADGTGTRGAP